MTADKPAQARRLDQALGLIQSKMAELKETIDVRRRQSFDAAEKVVATIRARS
jgi:CHASE3 domain sensor protein